MFASADVSSEVPLNNVSMTAYSQDVPREDKSAKLSKNLASALKMECNSEVDIKPSYQPDHKGEDVMFLWKMLMLHLWVRDRVWDPGIFTSKVRQI